MGDINVQKVEKSEDRTLPVFGQVDKLMRRVERRAYELFAGRGSGHGNAFDDWLAAEREICWSAAELEEREQDFTLSIALPGYEPSQVSVTASPSELIVHAAARTERREEAGKGSSKTLWSEFGSNDVYRHVVLAQPIDVSKVSATFSEGLLKVVAKKAVASAVPIPVAPAA